ncbi:hypothetical protein PITC_047790 [Penicillium italicum]|uniref:Fungal N-terminal domain-containing protein n=1 Tax=Penicillium italicum TaxID=40296 RepID=A0A0A2LDZ3_PENIT|nr:hypothetical protein PITC_047790 [Penicillium italicum]
MADLAGTAVGIISLGLQLCQGIVSYSEAWRGYDDEIQNARNKAKALRMLLKTLRDTIEELQQTRPEVAADLEEKAMSMQNSIEKLRKIVDRFKPARSEAFPEKVRTQLKKSVYYFQRESLQDMQNHLDQIQNVLQTTLLIYNWQDTMESRAMQISMYEEMRSMHSTLKDAISSTGMPPPSVLQLACNSHLKQLPMMLSDSGPLVQKNLGVVSENVSFISNLLNAFSEQRLSPYDAFYQDGDYGVESLMDVISSNFYQYSDKYGDIYEFQIMSETIKFMLECGMKPKKEDHWGFGSLLDICTTAVLRKEDLPLISNVIELRGPLQLYTRNYLSSSAPHFVNLKRNLRLILSQDEDLIQAPKIIKAIIQESEEGLREALESGRAPPDDRIGILSPLELAFGWPKGIQILLQSGENPHCHFPLLAMADGVEHHASAALLLEAGCVIEIADLVSSEQCNDGGKRYSLLVDHLAARRRRFCTMAESSLPPDQMPPLDGPATTVCAALAAHGINIPIELDFATDDHGSTAIYQTWLAGTSRDFIKIMHDMDEIGFHDVDMPNQYGVTPLMAFSPYTAEAAPALIKCTAWLMSKGASIERKMPASNAKVAHYLTGRVINLHYMDTGREPASSNLCDWKKGVAGLGDASFFVSPIQDCCICGCSPGGCTTLSVALRFIVLTTSQWRSEIQDRHFREMILSLTVWQNSWPGLSRAIVRTLTFDALGLTHTCCTEINQIEGMWVPFPAHERRDEAEIDRILDDQYLLLKEFEELMEEMESKLDGLNLPLEEFLDGYWYDRVIEHLSKRDHYDEEHVREAKLMGIFLEAEEFCIPDRLSFQFRHRVQELQEGSLLN